MQKQLYTGKGRTGNISKMIFTEIYCLPPCFGAKFPKSLTAMLLSRHLHSVGIYYRWIDPAAAYPPGSRASRSSKR